LALPGTGGQGTAGQGSGGVSLAPPGALGLSPGWTVSGTIRAEPASASLLTATIQLKQNGAAVGKVIRPAADGSYAIKRVPSGTGYTIEAALTGYSTITSGIFDVAGQGVTIPELILRGITGPTYRVSGKVSTDDGRGNPGAVMVQLKQKGINIGSPVYPDSTGVYTIAGVPAGTEYAVLAVLDGYGPGTSPAFEVTGDHSVPDIQLPRIPEYAVSGTVSADPPLLLLSDVTVYLKQGGLTLETGHPDTAGFYRLSPVPAGTGYTVEAAVNGYVTAVSGTFEVTGDVGGIDLKLEKISQPVYRVGGTISTNNGQGDLRAVLVQLKREGVNIGSPVSPDSSGAYTIENVPAAERYFVEVVLGGYETGLSSYFTVSGGDLSGIDLELEWIIPGYPVNGRIRTEDNLKDVSGVVVQLHRQGASSAQVHPAADGTYAFLDVAPGTYTLTASLPGYEDGGMGPFDVTGPLTLPDLELALSHYYVAGHGDDANSGTETRPFLTLNKGVEMAAASTGNRHVVVLGTLSERSGNPDNDYLFRLSGSSRIVTIRGKGPLGANPPYGACLTQTGTRGVLYINGLQVILKDIAITGGKGNRGGGVYVEGAKTSFTITGSSVTNNEAPEGGGVYLAGGSVMTIKDGSVTNNLASSGGGVMAVDSAVLTMENGSISGNTAAAYGGGVYLYNSVDMTLAGGSIEGNTAMYGGGVDLYNSVITMTGGSIKDNKATTGNGGGVELQVNSHMTIQNGFIEGNRAPSGGGVFVGISTLTVEGGFIMNNQATLGTGGGVCFAGSGMTMTGGFIKDNEAANEGGGLMVGGNMTMEGGSIEGNRAPMGAGVSLAGKTMTIKGGFIKGNRASYAGGGVHLFTSAAIFNTAYATLNIEGGSIEGNEAARGGGIHLSANGSKVLLKKGGRIAGNTASDNGGGVFCNIARASDLIMDPGSVIYGSDAAAADKNIAGNGNEQKGDAVWYERPYSPSSGFDSTVIK
jgi:hypothetical protein